MLTTQFTTVLLLLGTCCLSGVIGQNVAFVHPSDTANANASLELYAGFSAGLAHLNALNITNASYSFVDGYDGSNATNFTAGMAIRGDFAVVSPDFASSELLIPALGNTTTLVLSPRVSNSSFLDNVAFPNVIHMFPSLHEEVKLMMQHAVHSTAHCVRFAVVYQNYPGVTALVGAILSLVDGLGLPVPLQFLVGNSTDIAAVASGWMQDATNVPGCGFFLTNASVAVGTIEALYGAMPKPVFVDTYFYLSTLARSAQYASLISGMFDNVRVARGVNNWADALITSVHSYQQVYAQWVSSTPVLPPSLVAAGGALPLGFTPLSYEGFLLAMFLGQILQGHTPATGAAAVQELNTKKYLFYNEIAFGPYCNDGGLYGSKSPLPTECNQGAKTVYLTTQNRSGSAVFLPDDTTLGEVNIASLSIPMASCNSEAITIPNSLNVVVAAPNFTVGTDSYNSFQRLTDSMNRLYTSMNANVNVQTIGRFAVKWRSDYTPGVTNSDAYLAQIKTRNQPLALFAGYVPSGKSGIPSFYQAASSQSLNDPPLRQADAFSHYTFQFLPVIADYIHTGVAFLASSGTQRQYFVSTDDSEFLKAIVKSFNTFQMVPDVTDTLLGNNAALDSTLSTVFQQAATRDVCLVLGSNNKTLFTAAFDRVLRAAVLQATSVLQRVTLFVPVNVGFLTSYVTLPSHVVPPAEMQTFFVTYLPEFWLPTFPTYGMLAQLYNTTSASVVANAERVRGVIAATVLYKTTLTITAGKPSAQALVDAVYKEGTLSALGVTYGPLYKNNCSQDIIDRNDVDRSCQCYKGIRKNYALSLRDYIDGTAGRTGYFSFTMQTCGVQYLPLKTPPPSQLGLTLGVAIPCGLAGAACIAFLVYFATKPPRDNSCAPKDSETPFAIVFTDIQSSTSLWARCPQEMADCVETHHAEIRTLVKKYKGYEVKTIGDSFMVAFKEATNAASFALAIQTVFFEHVWPKEVDETYRDLAAEAAEQAEADAKSANPSRGTPQWADDVNYPLNWNGIRVRVGLHFGVGSVKLDPVSQGYDYYGTLVNTAARVEGVGNGGQVLATKDFFDELEQRGYSFDGVEVTPMGPQPLRGLDQPTPLFQLCPHRLKGRQFNALRLDVENDIESESVEEMSVLGSGASDSSAVSPEAHVHRVLAHKHLQDLTGVASRFQIFFETMLSTTSATYRNDLIKHLAKKWRCPVREAPKRSDAGVEQRVYDMNVSDLVIKTIFALNAAGKRGKFALGLVHTETDIMSMSASALHASSHRRSSHAKMLGSHHWTDGFSHSNFEASHNHEHAAAVHADA